MEAQTTLADVFTLDDFVRLPGVAHTRAKGDTDAHVPPAVHAPTACILPALPRGQLLSVWAQGGTLDKASGPQPVPPICRRRARDPVYGPLQSLAEGPHVVVPLGDQR